MMGVREKKGVADAAGPRARTVAVSAASSSWLTRRGARFLASIDFH